MWFWSRNAFGSKSFFPVVLFQRRNGRGLIELERQDIVRLQHSAELAGDDAGISAVGAARRGGVFVADQLRTAGRAVIDVHTVPRRVPSPPLAPARPVFRFLMECVRRLFVLLLIELFDLRDLKAAAAVLAFQLAGGSGKMQRASAGGALIISDLFGQMIASRQKIRSLRQGLRR